MQVLGRELSLSEIEQIAESLDTEIEAFVHGALCVLYSGQCFSSVVPLAFPLFARRPPGGAIAFGCHCCGGGVADVRHLILKCSCVGGPITPHPHCACLSN